MARTVTFHKFELEWKGGIEPRKQVIEGTDIADAMMRAGLGGGAYRALDSWRQITDDEGNTR